jgi:hypothetical protein
MVSLKVKRKRAGYLKKVTREEWKNTRTIIGHLEFKEANWLGCYQVWGTIV